jgi:hypothetical protein
MQSKKLHLHNDFLSMHNDEYVGPFQRRKTPFLVG